ncbi:MAG: hypothetical protein LQ351_007466 [Letrouitia transgressa]|nr:MAG: hypothetical protein LQ351_007466 [Letrouitia transgressa]
METNDKSNLPWHLGVYDAHCHPTDTISTLDEIATMKASGFTIMASRDEDQDLVHQAANKFRPPRLIPSFGWHPWFSHQIYDDRANQAGQPVQKPDKSLHYKSVLSPTPEEDDQEFVAALPEPRPLSEVLGRIRSNLNDHRLALVGEIGLDRSFRLPMQWAPADQDKRDPKLTPGGREGRRLSPYRVRLDHQRMLFKAQLNLAGELQRAVSVHGVAAHGVVLDTLRECWSGHERRIQSRRARKKAAHSANTENSGSSISAETDEDVSEPSAPKPYPPRVCLHSYSGPPDCLRQYLDPTVPVMFFFSFSCLVNFPLTTSKAVDVVRSVPNERLLVESDLHSAGKDMDDLLEQVVRKVCEIRKWSLEDGVQQLASNWRHFIYGSSDMETA